MAAAIEEEASINLGRKKVKVCGIKSCQSHINRTEKVAYFKSSPKTRDEWCRAIGKKRISSNFRICSIHFEESDIRKGVLLSTGEFIPFSNRWKLVNGAVPTKHLDLSNSNKTQAARSNVQQKEQEETSTSKQDEPSTSSIIPDKTASNNEKESPRTDSDVVLFQDHDYAAPALNKGNSTSNILNQSIIETRDKENNTNIDCEIVAEPPDNSRALNEPIKSLETQETNSNSLTDEMIKEIQEKVTLPSNDWHWLVNNEKKTVTCLYHSQLSETQLLVKSVVINNSSTISYFVNGKVVDLNLKKELNFLYQLRLGLRKFDNLDLCMGIKDETYNELEFSIKSKGIREADGVLRSQKCSLITNNDICTKCKVYYKHLQANKKTLCARSTKSRIQLIRTLRQKVSRTREKKQKLKVIVRELVSELEGLKKKRENEVLENFIEQLQPLERSMLRLYQIRLKALKGGNPGNLNCLRATRFDDSVKKHCGLLWLKSPSTYKFLRKHGIIPLPSLSLIAQYVKQSGLKDCNFQLTVSVENDENMEVSEEIQDMEEGELAPDSTSTCIEIFLG